MLGWENLSGYQMFEERRGFLHGDQTRGGVRVVQGRWNFVQSRWEVTIVQGLENVGDEQAWGSKGRGMSRKVMYNRGKYQTRVVIGVFLKWVEGRAKFLMP